MLVAAFISGTYELWVYFTILGDERLYLLLSIVIYYFTPNISNGLLLISSVLISGSINISLKYIFNLPRPPDPLVQVEGPGFPSGHAQITSSFWSAKSLIYKKNALSALALIIILGVSISRVYLRAHYLHDVFWGAVLGILIGLACYGVSTFSVKRDFYMPFISLQAFVLTLSIINLSFLSGDKHASSSLVGLSAAVLLTVVFCRGQLKESSPGGPLLRGVLSAASSLLLLATHYYTLGVDVFIRSACFFLSGLLVFLLPFALMSYSKRAQ
ncbi:MAG: phosphatase PAP2 family protein [Desulfurococcaceae archaeon]